MTMPGSSIELIAADIVQRIEVGPSGAAIYESLINGSARLTLDDGEAATIACAVELAGVALIDERKARALCAVSFAALPLVCTVQLIHDAVVAALGAQSQVDALIAALQRGRMRVPTEYMTKVVALIRPENAANCASLPKAARVVDLS